VVDPIILADDLIGVATTWSREALGRVGTLSGTCELGIGEAAIQSPADAKERNVKLYLTSEPMNAVGMTFPPNVRFRRGDPDRVENRYVIMIHDRRDYFRHAFGRDRMLATLLHELTHVIDPQFIEDTLAKQQTDAVKVRRPADDYALASEQRAFTAMWIAHLKHYLAGRAGQQFSAEDFAMLVAGLSPEFEGYYRQNFRLQPLVHDHFVRMADHILTSVASASRTPPGE
jgi:hypothetical protein